MRIIYITSILFILFTACNSSSTKKERKAKKQELFGTLNNNIYTNSFFNLKASFDENWNVNAKSLKSVTFGGKCFSAIYRNSYNQEYPIDITMEVDKGNPFESPSVIRKLDESKEGYEMIFSYNEMQASKYDKVTIAGKTFAHCDFLFLQEQGDTSHIHEYYTFLNGYYLSIICTYNNNEDGKVAMDFISSIKKKK